jgi:hypothetical protein
MKATKNRERGRGTASAEGASESGRTTGATKTSALLAVLAGCHPSDYSSMHVHPADASVDAAANAWAGGRTIVPTGPLQPKVDLLIMVDNSPSMTPRQQALASTWPTIVTQLQALQAAGVPASFHIGVVTSDLGAGQVTTIGQCMVGGLHGDLIGVGAGNTTTGCAAPVGHNWIDFDVASGASNLPVGQTITDTLDCMTNVGALGCGFEHQLESVYQSFVDAANAGFLRPDAVLAILFLTDEDDCSAPPDTDLFNPDPDAGAKYGQLQSYRCTQFGVACGTPPKAPPYAATDGGLLDCQAGTAATGAKLFDVTRYLDRFTKPTAAGGVKDDPANDVIVGAITGDLTPFYVQLAGPGLFPVTPCSPIGPVCFPQLGPSCVPADPAQAAVPAVRLAQVVNGVGQHMISSVCASDYTPAVTQFDGMIASRLEQACLGVKLAAPTDCVVEDAVVDAAGNVTSATDLPMCGGATPCWQVSTSGPCTRIAVDRGGAAPPAGTKLRAACTTAP